MYNTGINFVVGASYPQHGAMLRVIAVKYNTVLLEQWRDDQLIQYIVTSGLFLHEGDLQWNGSGAYYPCMYPPPVCDEPFEALRKAMKYMNAPCKDNDVIADAGCGASAVEAKSDEISFSIPNGIRIVAEMNGDAIDTGNGWSGIDICAKFPSGHCEYLCCVDFEPEDEFGYDHLRVMTYKHGDEHPDTITEPLPHRSIWLSYDEGTYDVNVWDESLDTRDEPLEVGHIPTLEEGEYVMNQIIQNNPFIWTRRELQVK